MGGFASFIGGLGPELNKMNEARAVRHFQHNEASIQHLHDRYQNLGQAFEKLRQEYPESPEVQNAIADAHIELLGGDVSEQTLKKLTQNYLKTQQLARQQRAEKAQQDAVRSSRTPAVNEALDGLSKPPQSQIPPVGAAPQAANPLSNIISGSDTGFTGAGRVSPNPPGAQLIAQAGAAQAPTSPIDGRLPQGGGRPAATFPANPPAPVTPEPIPQIPGAAELDNGPQPGANAPILPPVDPVSPTMQMQSGGASVAPLVDIDPILTQALQDFRVTGRMTPTLKAAIDKQMGTQAGLETKYREGEIGRAGRKKTLEDIHGLPSFTSLPSIAQGSIDANVLSGMSLPSYAGLMTPKPLAGWVKTSDLPEGTTDFLGDPISTPYVKKFLLNGELQYIQDVGPGTRSITMPDAKSPTGYSLVILGREGEEVSRTLGAQPPASTIGSSSTVTSPGAVPVTTKRTPVLPGAGGGTQQAAPTIAPIPGAPAPARPTATGGGASSTIASYAKDVSEGRITLEGIGDARMRAAVRDYMGKNKLDIPDALTAAGQSNLQAVDAVFAEIDDLEKQLNTINGDPNLAPYYLQYKLGMSTPYDSLFTKLSFESLRSAAAALKGNNSRAYPVLQRAFEHTPNLDRAFGIMPDSIPLIKDKLKAMRKVLQDTKQTVTSDQRKSGVPKIEGLPGASAGPAPKTAQEYLERLQ